MWRSRRREKVAARGLEEFQRSEPFDRCAADMLDRGQLITQRFLDPKTLGIEDTWPLPLIRHLAELSAVLNRELAEIAKRTSLPGSCGLCSVS
jgi:hypothetical protein